MTLRQEVWNWTDGMAVVWESIQVQNNGSDSLHELFEPLSSWTKIWYFNRDSKEPNEIREAVERLF